MGEKGLWPCTVTTGMAGRGLRRTGTWRKEVSDIFTAGSTQSGCANENQSSFLELHIVNIILGPGLGLWYIFKIKHDFTSNRTSVLTCR